MPVSRYVDPPKIAEAIQAAGTVGIKANIYSVEWGTYLQKPKLESILCAC